MNILASFLVTTSLLLAVSTSTTTYIAPKSPDITSKVQVAPQTIKDKVYSAARKYGVSGDDMWATIQCENKDLDPLKQSGYYTNGVQEQSFGLVQINLPSHPTISYAQATDVDFSIDFMAKQFADGNERIWTCYRLLANGRR